jgi:DNA repair exonuclease SbcCD ATPase subunit
LQEKKLQEFEKQVNKLQNTERELRGELSLVRQSVLHLESDNEKLKERLAQVRLMTMGMALDLFIVIFAAFFTGMCMCIMCSGPLAQDKTVVKKKDETYRQLEKQLDKDRRDRTKLEQDLKAANDKVWSESEETWRVAKFQSCFDYPLFERSMDEWTDFYPLSGQARCQPDCMSERRMHRGHCGGAWGCVSAVFGTIPDPSPLRRVPGRAD